MLVGLVLVDKIYLDLKCLLYKIASNFFQPGVFIIEKRENKKRNITSYNYSNNDNI